MQNRTRNAIFVLVALLMSIGEHARALTLSSTDVNYLSPGTAFAETIILDGVTVSLTSSGAEIVAQPGGEKVIRFSDGDSVTWDFDKPISSFSIDFTDFFNGGLFDTSILDQRNPFAQVTLSPSLFLFFEIGIGNPPIPAGTAQFDGLLNTSSVTFSYTNANGVDASVSAYGLAVAPVPLPFPALLLASAFAALLLVKRSGRTVSPANA